jgi:hypothetical protein
MQLVQDGGALRIEGEGSDRARIAYAVIDGDKIVYQITARAERAAGV